MRLGNIEIHIEELVLDGFEQSDRYRISEAVERELERLLTEKGMPESFFKGGEIERLDGGVFEISHGSRPEVIGSHVARAVYGGKIR